jgi:flagellin-like hook-associated protein FlgL
MTNISSNMNLGLVSLLDINSQMQEVQTRLSTGKKLNSAADGAVQWLTVTNFQNRIAGLQSVNDGLTTAISQIKSASTGLTSVRKLLSDTLGQLKDASTTQEAVSNVVADNPTALNNTQVGIQFKLTTGQVAGNTSLDNANLRLNGEKLAQGSVFKFEVNGTTKFIKIGKAADPVPAATLDGNTQDTAYQVRTVTEFNSALSFGGLSPTAIGAGSFNQIDTTITLNSIAGQNAFKISQVVAGTGENGNLVAMFSSKRGNYNPTTGTAGNFDDMTENSGTYGAQSVTYKGTAHTGTKGSASVNPDAKRAVAANAVVSLVDQINQLVRDSKANGVNLLKGDDLTVVINAEGDSLRIQFPVATGATQGQAFDAAGLGLDLTNFGLAGTNVTNFATNTTLTTAITALQAALDNSDIGISKLGTWQSSVDNRSSFNNSMLKILNTAVTSLTSNDATADAAELASLQTRQTFANSILSIIRQGEQNPIQLLR